MDCRGGEMAARRANRADDRTWEPCGRYTVSRISNSLRRTVLIVSLFSSWLATRWSEVEFVDGQMAVAKDGVIYTTQGRTGERYREVQETRNKN